MPPTAQKIARSDTGLASTLRVSMARLTRRLRTEDVDDLGVSPGQLGVLGVLLREGERTIGQLAAAERVQPPSMTRTVGCLVDAGLVRRDPHPTDGRQVVVSLTAEGESLAQAIRRRRDSWMASRLEGLSPEQRAVLAEAAPLLLEVAARD